MTALDEFIADARKVDLETVFGIVEGQLGRKRAQEFVGPCPACGGRDRFSINLAKGLWFCRQYDGGRGGDGLELVAHKLDVNLKLRAGLLAACAEILGRPVPDGGERESAEERAERETRLAARRAAMEQKQARDRKDDDWRRQQAINQGRGMWLNARDAGGSAVEAYLKLRTGAARIPDAVWDNLRLAPRHTNYEGKDERGNKVDVHCGPAMIAPLVDLAGHITGAHQTWIDLGNGPKYRPAITVTNGKGEREAVPTKKMRGHKTGSLIPVCGDLDLKRWVVGEGIETVLAIAAAEGFRDDTFYCAAGDIGNMAGPADAKSRFAHPTLKKQDVKGVWRPVMVAGPVPKPDSEDDAFQLAADVAELVLLADGDSEFMMTAAAMARAEARLAREGLTIAIWWPPAGGDFADMAVRAGMGNAA